MTLLTRHIDAGWHEVWHGTKRVAEKFHSQPGATSTVLREEADTQKELHQKLDLRESQLSNEQAIVTWPQGARVTDAEHSAAQILGTAPTSVSDPAPVALVVEPEAQPADADGNPIGPPPEKPAEGALSDEERARIAADEAALEAAAE